MGLRLCVLKKKKKRLCVLTPRAQVQSLVGELRSTNRTARTKKKKGGAAFCGTMTLLTQPQQLAYSRSLINVRYYYNYYLTLLRLIFLFGKIVVQLLSCF